MKKTFLIIGFVIIVLLVMLAFILPRLGPASEEVKIWSTRIYFLSIYARELNNFLQDEQSLPEMDNFKNFLKSKRLSYQSFTEWEVFLKKAYGENHTCPNNFQNGVIF